MAVLHHKGVQHPYQEDKQYPQAKTGEDGCLVLCPAFGGGENYWNADNKEKGEGDKCKQGKLEKKRHSFCKKVAGGIWEAPGKGCFLSTPQR